MKWYTLILISAAMLVACAEKPTACECGKNLMKATDEQDMDLYEACEREVQSLPESKQMDWYNESMECMNEQ